MCLSSEFAARINAGEAFDVIAAPPAALDGLIKNGKASADSKISLTRTAWCVAVRAGAPKPDIGSVDAFKNALLSAKSITYLPVPGVPQIIERLGIKDAIASKVTIPRPTSLPNSSPRVKLNWGSSPLRKCLLLPALNLSDLSRLPFSSIRPLAVQSAPAQKCQMQPGNCSRSSRSRL